MYLHLELKTIATERLDVAVQRLHYLHSLMAKTQGFIEAQTCEFLGNPGQYLVLRRWDAAESHAAYRASDASKAFAASRPAEFIYDNLAVQEWTCEVEARGEAKGDYIVRRLSTIDPASWAERLGEEERAYAAAIASGGSVALRTYRMLANAKADDTQALSIDRWASRTSYVQFLDGRDRRAGELIECFQVVDEVLP